MARAAASRLPRLEATPLAETLLASPFVWEREKALDEMARLGSAGPVAEDALARALREDRSPWVRAAAAVVAGAVRPKGWDLRLADALRNDASAYVRMRAAESLGRPPARGEPRAAGRKSVIASLAEALGSDTPRVAAAAARSLALLGGADGEVLRALESPSALVREAAALAIRERATRGRGIEGSRGRLERLLGDPDERVRLAAAVTMGRTGGERAREALESLAESAVPVDAWAEYPGAATVGEVARAHLGTPSTEEEPRP